MSAPMRNPLAAEVVDKDSSQIGWVDYETEQWLALMEWCKFHNIDPHRVLGGTRIERHGDGCRILYTRICLTPEGEKDLDSLGNVRFEDVYEQGEAPPLPFPDSIDFVPMPVGGRL